MANLKVRQLDERVANALKTRASKRGVSLEEEVRSTLGRRPLRPLETPSGAVPPPSAPRSRERDDRPPTAHA